ncbi:unnamed protein product [Callosobruchus maculatus]|uniref:Uncharacterized protein n=1 Tax=Callosobruchus maculatus TaxID=64391 RepID=A0A653CBY5_CALMS|nr:unnamed protein product [Callosobruchus maculatus]
MKAAVKIAFHNCSNMRDPMNWLSHKTWWPFSRNTYGSSLNGFRNTLEMMMSKNLRESKFPFVRKLRQNSPNLIWWSFGYRSKAFHIYMRLDFQP